MNIDVSEKYLQVFEALASNVRIHIIHLLSEKAMSIREIADGLGLSSAIMTMHIKKLEKAGIISSEMTPGKGGAAKKMCSLVVNHLDVSFPTKHELKREYRQTEISIGHYTDLQISPTCGICTRDGIIGIFDDPRFFLDPSRVNAKILWFGQGYVEYKMPNYLTINEIPHELEISMEISSEAPLTNNEWPSDITFYVNGIKVGMWTSPGDFGGNSGRLNPHWWFSDINQYGLLKRLIISKDGTYMDGIKLSDITLDQVNIRQKSWTFRIAVQDDAEHVGGVTLFGAGFGNYNQDIIVKLYYTKSIHE